MYQTPVSFDYRDGYQAKLYELNSRFALIEPEWPFQSNSSRRKIGI